jgi:uncharacterized repeat protein (TIGR03803 family)
LLLASDGSFYGTTKQGGRSCNGAGVAGCGVVFRITSAGTYSILYRFKGGVEDGRNPQTGVIQGSDGALYGTTLIGGKNDTGVAFRLSLTGEYKVLHHFDLLRGTGDRPNGRLVEAPDGNFYGATIGGGPNTCASSACGTIFRLTPAGDHRVIYYFGSKPGDGSVPNGSLVIGTDGALYGTNVVGGDDRCSNPNQVPRIDGCGTVFRITTSGELTTLHAFGPTTSGGILPMSGLVRGPDGTLYGTTYGGGMGQCINSSGGCGTVFRVTPAGQLSVLYQFSLASTQLPGETISGSDGFNPIGLTFGSDGRLYGGTESGGVTTRADTGTLFSLTLQGTKTILYRFNNSSEGPAVPTGGLVEAPDGTYWGVTTYNGKFGSVGVRGGFGTIFRLTVPK